MDELELVVFDISSAHNRQMLEGLPHSHLLPSVAELTGLWAGG